MGREQIERIERIMGVGAGSPRPRRLGGRLGMRVGRPNPYIPAQDVKAPAGLKRGELSTD